MEINRRQLVIAGSSAISVALAGCSGGGSREQIIDNRAEINEDGYKYWSFSLEDSATIEYEFTVRSGPEMEVFVLEDSEFREYEAGNRFRGHSSSGTGGSNSVTLNAGDYKLVVDNTNTGDVSPPTNFDDDVAEIEIEVYLED